MVDGIDVYAVESVHELVAYINGEIILQPVFDPEMTESSEEFQLDFCDVKGQYEVKRALEIAAAGSHNLLMIGSPGSGKSMMAKRLPSILPEMTFSESLEATKVYSIAGELPPSVQLIKTRPFRSPHHTISAAGLAGGGTVPKPGEISLSHNGVLFLDELPEFTRQAMEIMRQPIEDGTITIARTAGTVTYPCETMLVGAMNPCPCGFFGHPTKECSCSDASARRYLSKISGPLLDRIDIHVEVQPVAYEQLAGDTNDEKSEAIRHRVNEARKIQQQRFAGTNIKSNAKMPANAVREYCVLSGEAQQLLQQSFDALGMSARAYDKILRLARTIADLDYSSIIEISHVAEAIQYRSLDRKYWSHET